MYIIRWKILYRFYIPLLEKDDVFVFKIVVIAERLNMENEVKI